MGLVIVFPSGLCASCYCPALHTWEILRGRKLRCLRLQSQRPRTNLLALAAPAFRCWTPAPTHERPSSPLHPSPSGTRTPGLTVGSFAPIPAAREGHQNASVREGPLGIPTTYLPEADSTAMRASALVVPRCGNATDRSKLDSLFPCCSPTIRSR